MGLATGTQQPRNSNATGGWAPLRDPALIGIATSPTNPIQRTVAEPVPLRGPLWHSDNSARYRWIRCGALSARVKLVRFKRVPLGLRASPFAVRPGRARIHRN
jgi:hypothetical protein